MSHFMDDVDIDRLLTNENVPFSKSRQLSFSDPLLAIPKDNGVSEKDLTFLDLEKQMNMTASQIPSHFTQMHNPVVLNTDQTLSSSIVHRLQSGASQNESHERLTIPNKTANTLSTSYSESRSQSRERKRFPNSNGSYNSSPESNFPYTPVDSLESCTTDSNIETDVNLLKTNDFLGTETQPMPIDFISHAQNHPQNQTQIHKPNLLNEISHDIHLNDNMTNHRFLLNEVLDSDIDKMISGEMELPIGNIQSQLPSAMLNNDNIVKLEDKPLKMNELESNNNNIQEFKLNENKKQYRKGQISNFPHHKIPSSSKNDFIERGNVTKTKLFEKKITKPNQSSSSKNNSKSIINTKRESLLVENIDKGKLVKCFKTLRNNYLHLCDSYNEVVDRLNETERERKVLASQTGNSAIEKEDWMIEKDRILLEREDMKGMLDALLHEVTILRRKDKERTK